MSGNQDKSKNSAKEEVFNVKDLVSNDPDFPKGILPAKKTKTPKSGRRHPGEKTSRRTSSKTPTFIIIALAIVGSVILLAIALFVLIRHVLPPFQ